MKDLKKFAQECLDLARSRCPIYTENLTWLCVGDAKEASRLKHNFTLCDDCKELVARGKALGLDT